MGIRLSKILKILSAVTLLGLFLSSCVGPDYMPDYFPISDTNNDTGTQGGNTTNNDENAASGSCIIKFTSTLCVSIKAESLEVGVGDSEPLCADIDPILFEISGTSVILRGSNFPDIPFEGHGLPAPITINGKGSSDGTQNIGKGKIDGNNLYVEGFSFFINALGMVGELPDITLTTGAAEDVEDLPHIEGEALDGKKHMKLVASTIVGHLFPAADEKLFGASLQATLDGEVSSAFSECKGSSGGAPQSTYVTKLVTDSEGKQTEALLPGSIRMEIGAGTFIANNSTDVGPKFEASAKFKIINASGKAFDIDIPQQIGPFIIEPVQGASLTQSLPPKIPITVKITFRPTKDNTSKSGEVVEALTIGPDIYQLVGEAIEPSGKVSADILDESGKLLTEQANSIDVGESTVTTNSRREFFICKKITCNNTDKYTECVPCVDVLTNVCTLLPVDTNGNPVGVVDSQCKEVNSNSKDDLTVNLSNQNGPPSRIIELKNRGSRTVVIKQITIKDPPNSRSKEQFKLGSVSGLPVSLKPFEDSHDSYKTVVLYNPTDIIGTNGQEAFVGHPAKDSAVLYVETDNGTITIELSGTTSVKEVPALEVYIRSSTGTKMQLDGSSFSFRGITTDTSEMSVPVFIKLSDSATSSLKITKIELGNGGNFEWLDTKEKINAKPESTRCAIPVLDSNGNMTGRITDLNPISLATNGFTLAPGGYSVDNMPLFGCVNFKMSGKLQRKYESELKVYAQEIGRDGEPVRNNDGSVKQTNLNIKFIAVVNPFKGKIVFRMTQTIAGILNPQFPSISAASSKEEMDMQIKDGIAKDYDRFIMVGAVILDPFDEETIKDEKGNVITTPNDGITAVYRNIDTHPVSKMYDDSYLPDYTSLIFDSSAEEGEQGVFFDYPNVADNLQLSTLRIYTASLSYPGPLAKPEERPESQSLCEDVDPCSEEGQKKLGLGNKNSGKLGVCAYFYTSAGNWDSPALHKASEMSGGELDDLCKAKGARQNLKDITGKYNLNGTMNFADIGLRIWGPTFFHNPSGPLGPVPPMDAIFHVAFTTETLKPDVKDENGNPIDLIPDKRVNTSKQEHKLNLNDANLDTPKLCDGNTKNRAYKGQYYSTWRYLIPFISKDEAATIPAGCPESDNTYNGGSAFLHGRPLDQETGIVSFVSIAKFASDDNLTFAFKDVLFFIVLNGWFCDPTGDEANFEGSKCYDKIFNERDGKTTIGIMR